MEAEEEEAWERRGVVVTKEQFSERIDQLFDAERWADARALIVGALRSHRGSHWLLSRLSTTYYEERNYKKALEVAKRAYAVAPHCPLVLWDLAGAWDATGHTETAIQIYQHLIGRGERTIAHDECGEGMQWAQALITDCWYRLGLCFEDKGDKSQAVDCLQKFLNRLIDGSASIYAEADAVRQLKRLGATALTFELSLPYTVFGDRDRRDAGTALDFGDNLHDLNVNAVITGAAGRTTLSGSLGSEPLVPTLVG